MKTCCQIFWWSLCLLLRKMSSNKSFHEYENRLLLFYSRERERERERERYRERERHTHTAAFDQFSIHCFVSSKVSYKPINNIYVSPSVSVSLAKQAHTHRPTHQQKATKTLSCTYLHKLPYKIISLQDPQSPPKSKVFPY